MELREYFYIVWNRLWLVVATTILAAVAAFTVSKLKPPVYRSAITLDIESGVEPGGDPYTLLRGTQAVAETYVQQINTSPILKTAIARLGLSMSVSAVKDILSIRQVPGTSMIDISVEHGNPELSYALVTTIVDVFTERKTSQQRARYETALTEMEQDCATLESEIEEIRAAIAYRTANRNRVPADAVTMAGLETDLATAQTRHAVLLQSAEQFRLEMAKSGDSITVFAPAELPTSPVDAQVLRNTALGTVVGGMIGVGTAFLMDYLDDTLHNADQATSLLGVNVLGSLLEAENGDTGPAVTIDNPLSMAAESFRRLRTNLGYASVDHQLRSLQITSTDPQEGKSYVVANLGVAYALQGKRVLILDADLRRPTQHSAFWDVPRKRGLTDAIVALAESPEEDCRDVILGMVKSSPVQGLHLLTAGSSVPNPTEMLDSRTFERLIHCLIEEYDLVLIDTPPVLAVADAEIIANRVDGVVMLALSGKTRVPLALSAIEHLNKPEIRFLGLVINRITRSSARYGGYNYYPSYQYEPSAE